MFKENALPLRKKSPRLLFLLTGNRDKASSRVRGYWIAQALAARNINTSVHIASSRVSLLSAAVMIPFNDIVIFQKTYSKYHKLLMRWAHLLGKLVYLDIDDAPSRSDSPITLRNFEAMARMSNGVLAGSRKLANYAAGIGATSHLVPSGIKMANYRIHQSTKQGEPLVIGWIGNGEHYGRDLVDILKPSLAALAPTGNIKVKIVGALGNKQLHSEFENLEGIDACIIDSIDWSSADSVDKAMRDMDIGVYPLLNNDFNEYKCGFKALEYMACGIPVVASPNPANSDIIVAGTNGYLATSIEDWRSCLEKLVVNAPLREAMGSAGRQQAEAMYSIHVITDRILDIFTQDGAGKYGGWKQRGRNSEQ